jgi:hypothetical protein
MHRICIFLLIFISFSIGQRVVISIVGTKEFPFSFTCPDGTVLFSNQFFSSETFLELTQNTTDNFTACATSFTDNIDASFNLSQTSTRLVERIVFPYKESQIFHLLADSKDFYPFQLRAIIIYGRDLDSEDEVLIDVAFIGNTCGDNIRDLDLGEDCDSSTECDSFCGCMAGYQPDLNNLESTHCIVAPSLGLLWLIVPFIAITVGLILILSVLKRKGKLRCCNDREPEPDQEVEMAKLQPIEQPNYPHHPYNNNQNVLPPQPMPYPPLSSVLPPSNFGSGPVFPYPPNQPHMPIPPPPYNPYGPSPYMEVPNPMPMPQVNYGPVVPPHPPV